MNKLEGFFPLLLAGLFYALFGIFVRLLGDQLLAYQQIFLRNVSGFVLAVVAVVITRASWSLTTNQKWFLFLFAFPYPLTTVFLTLSYLQTEIAVTSFALYIGSLVATLLIGKVFFKEKITKIKLMSLLLVLTGLTFFTLPFSSKSINTGLVFGLLAGISSAMSSSLRKFLGGQIDRFILIVVQMIGGISITSLLVVFFHETRFPILSLFNLFVLFIFGGLVVLIAYLMLIGFQNFDLNLGTIVLSSEVFFAPLFGAIIFKEYLTMFELLGGTFIIIAIILPNVPQPKTS